MRFLALDDENTSLANLEECIRTAAKDAKDLKIDAFSDPAKALDAALSNDYTAIFMDINMGGRRKGIELAAQIREKAGNVNIIFCTGYSEFTGDAMMLHASGYILKPVTPEKISRELGDLRYSGPEAVKVTASDALADGMPEAGAANGNAAGSGQKLRIQTFGNFEVFYDNIPLNFAYNKTREMLAYFVDRKGALATNAEICELLWEDSGPSKDSYLRNIRGDLVKVLQRCGQEAVLVRQKGLSGINPELVDCDYYELLADMKSNGGRPSSAGGYFGEYMSQYPWGNFTNNWLLNRVGL